MLYMIWFCSFQSCFNSLLIHSTRWPVFFPWWSIHVSKLLYLALFSRYSGTLVWEINPYSKIQFRIWNIKTSEYVYTYKIDPIHNHLYKHERCHIGSSVVPPPINICSTASTRYRIRRVVSFSPNTHITIALTKAI